MNTKIIFLVKSSKAIFSFFFLLIIGFGAKAQFGYNQTYIGSGQFVDNLASTGQYRVCQPQVSPNPFSFGAGLSFENGPNINATYSPNSYGRQIQCGRYIPNQNQQYYIDDKRFGIYSGTRTYQGW